MNKVQIYGERCSGTCEPKVSVSELRLVYKYLTEPDIQEYIISEYFDIEGSGDNAVIKVTNVEYNKLISELKKITDNYTQMNTSSEQSIYISSDDIDKIKYIFKTIQGSDCFDFTCYMCHRGCKVQY